MEGQGCYVFCQGQEASKFHYKCVFSQTAGSLLGHHWYMHEKKFSNKFLLVITFKLIIGLQYMQRARQ